MNILRSTQRPDTIVKIGDRCKLKGYILRVPVVSKSISKATEFRRQHLWWWQILTETLDHQKTLFSL